MSGMVRLLMRWVRRIKRTVSRPVLWVPVVLAGALVVAVFVVPDFVVWVVVDAYDAARESGADETLSLIVATTFAGMLGTTIVFFCKRIGSWGARHLLLWAERAIRDRTVDLDSGVVGRDTKEREKMVMNSVVAGALSRWLSLVFVSRTDRNDSAFAIAIVEYRSAQRDYKSKLERELKPWRTGKEESEELRSARMRCEAAWSKAMRYVSVAFDDNRASHRMARWSVEVIDLEQEVEARWKSRREAGGTRERSDA